MADRTGVQHIRGYCGFCIARCGSVATVEDGRFTRLDRDPAHPTGQALCAKGRAAPELVYHPDRLTYPLRRTRPKGDPDPGWQPISWNEALELTAAVRAALDVPDAALRYLAGEPVFRGTELPSRDGHGQAPARQNPGSRSNPGAGETG